MVLAQALQAWSCRFKASSKEQNPSFQFKAHRNPLKSYATVLSSFSQWAISALGKSWNPLTDRMHFIWFMVPGHLLATEQRDNSVETLRLRPSAVKLAREVLPCALFYCSNNRARMPCYRDSLPRYRDSLLHSESTVQPPSALSTSSSTDVVENPPKRQMLQGADPKSTLDQEATHLVSPQENYWLLSYSNLGYLLSIVRYHFVKSWSTTALRFKDTPSDSICTSHIE